jgi:hypothetical protein
MAPPFSDLGNRLSLRLIRIDYGAPPNPPTIWMTAGPRITTNRAGKMNIAIGTIIFSGAVAAFLSAV